MRTFRILASVLLLSAVAALSACGGGAEFGVSASTPIGKLAKMEAYLAGKGLTSQPKQKEEVRQVLGEWVMERDDLTFVEHGDAIPGYKHAVIFAKKGDQLVAVGAQFRSGAFAFSTIGTKVESFTARLWQDVAGKDATFEKKFDKGLGMREYMIATCAKGKAKGSWRKDSQDAEMKNPRGVIDKVVFRVE